MVNKRLSLTRDQLASFLQDFEQIKQFERLFATTDANVISIDDVNIAAGNAGESANDALAQIIALSDTLGITPPDLGGTVTSVAASGGTTGLTFTGSPITTSGTLTLGGTLAVANGGTGQTSYTDGQLLIGNTTGNTLTKATLIAGTNISITNGAGSITISSTAGTGTVTSVGGTGTVNGITLTGTVTTSGNLTLGGTLSGVSLTTQVSGTLPVANGGTGTATTFTSGSVVFAGASGVYSQDNANLFWDGTNDRLGIGTVLPASELDVAGTITVSAAAGNYTIDTSGAAVSVANGGTVNFSNASGMLLVNSHTNGFASIYLMGGGNVSVPGTQTYAGGAVGAVTYNAGINGYTWTNNSGGTVTVGFMFFRTRAAA